MAELLSRVVCDAKPSAAGQPTTIPYQLKLPPYHESAVNTMTVDDDAQQQPRNAAANGGHQDPADHDEHGLLVTLRADLSDEDVDAVAQSIEEVSGGRRRPTLRRRPERPRRGGTQRFQVAGEHRPPLRRRRSLSTPVAAVSND